MSGLEFVQGSSMARYRVNSMAQTLGLRHRRGFQGRVVAAAEPMRGTSTPPAPCMAALPQPCSTAAWDSPCRSMLDKGFAQTNARVQDFAGPACHAETGLVKAKQSDQLRARIGTAEGTLTDKDGRVLRTARQRACSSSTDTQCLSLRASAP